MAFYIKIVTLLGATKDLFIDIIQNKLLLFSLSVVFYFFLILAFTFIYSITQKLHLAAVENYKGKTLQGFKTPTPAFILTGEIKTRVQIKALNELFLNKFGNQILNMHWRSFNQDNSLIRQFPNEKQNQSDFNDVFTRGLKPSNLVDEAFNKYWSVEFNINSYRDNIFLELFPFKVMNEFAEETIDAFKNRINQNLLTPQEINLYNELIKTSNILLQNVLTNHKTQNFGNLSMLLNNEYNKLDPYVWKDKARFKEIFFGMFLDTLTNPGVEITYNLEKLIEYPTFTDFFYFSSMVATNNVPSDILPVTDDARFIVWIQMMLSYFLLALLIGVVLNALKL